MAKVWLVNTGSEPTSHGDGEPFQELDLTECVSKLGLTKEHWRTDIGTTPRFDDPVKRQGFRGPELVVVEIGEAEAKASGWKPGFYSAPPDEARKQLRIVLQEQGSSH